MDLMEFKARELFEEAGMPVLKGFTVTSVEELEAMKDSVKYPAVIKAQVQIGGRGKAGGIKFADNFDELKARTSEILGMDIKGHTVERVMIVEKAEVTSEMYLSIMLDRNSKKHIIIFSPCGGMDIEQTAKETPEKIFKTEIDPLLGLNPQTATYLGNKAGLDKEQKKQFSALLAKMYKMCRDKYCMLAEINPLAVDGEGNILALDAKVSIDDSAVKKLPEIATFKESLPILPLVKEAAEYDFLYIPCEDDGNVVVISNGSGMLMSCIDHIAKQGMKVAAVLDLGGGATSDRIKHAVRILLKTPGAKILFINIFGGITRCNEVAGGIRAAVEEYNITSPIIVRFEGTNKDIGLEIIEGIENVVYVDGLISGVAEVVREGKSL